MLILSQSGLLHLWGADQMVGQRRFQQVANHWIEQGLSEKTLILPDHACVYKDQVWQDWFDQGNAELQRILDLGQSVIFWFPEPGTKNRLAYRVFRTHEHLAEARELGLVGRQTGPLTNAATSGKAKATTVAGSKGISMGTTALVVGSAAAVAGIAAVSGGSGGSDSQSKR